MALPTIVTATVCHSTSAAGSARALRDNGRRPCCVTLGHGGKRRPTSVAARTIPHEVLMGFDSIWHWLLLLVIVLV
ncbi:MAG TPA: hypothetical protein VJN66_01245, partial [Rhodanobacteraceae bacterium]|nr:hypothetical protein [Rhodanobacteraceae bacterium]